MNILIIDDEYLIREKLKKYLKTAPINNIKILEASNGNDGLNIILEKNIDLILSDIQMPLLNGIELLHELIKLKLHPPIIFLTGFEKFEYAKEALDYGVISYLLKPIKKDELFNALNKVNNLLNKKSSYLLTDCIIRENFNSRLINLLNLNEIKLNFTSINEPFICSKITISHNFNAKKFYDNIKSFLNKFDISLKEANTKLIFTTYDNLQPLKIFLNKCIENNILINASISNAHSLNTIKDSIIQCELTLESYIFSKNKLLEYSKLNNNSVLIPENLRKDLILLLRAKDIDGLFNSIIFYMNKINKYKDICSLKILLTEIILAIYYININEITTNNYNNVHQIVDKFITSNNSINSLINNLRTYILDIYENEELISSNSTLYTVLKVKEYIDQNFCNNNLSLEFLSKNFFVNPCHLSHNYKKLLGESIIEYITRLRIDKAKSLLLNNSIKIAEISNIVGYTDYYYFSKKFKKHVGISPSKFYNNTINYK